MVKVTQEPFNYDDESWVISSRGYMPPRKKPAVGPDKVEAEPPELEDGEPAETDQR